MKILIDSSPKMSADSTNLCFMRFLASANQKQRLIYNCVLVERDIRTQNDTKYFQYNICRPMLDRRKCSKMLDSTIIIIVICSKQCLLMLLYLRKTLDNLEEISLQP